MPIVVCDTETTGLPHDEKARPVAISLIVIDDEYNRLFDTTFYVKPSVWSPNYMKAQEIHGLTPGFLALNGMSESDALEVLCAIDDKYECPRWTSYNRKFDLEMLSRIGFNPLHKATCIMELAARKLNKKSNRVALAEAYPEITGESFLLGQAHKAEYDAKCALEVYIACVHQ